MRFFCTVLVCFIIPLAGMGQNPVSQNFTIAHGLPSNRVYHTILDGQGFLWFCTDKGVSRYDGYGFQNFTTRDGLTDNEVFHMFLDSKNRIWFMAYNGKLGYYQNGRFYNPQNTPFLRAAISAAMYSRAFEDKWGNIAFITSLGGVYVLNNDSFYNTLAGANFFSPYVANGEIYLPYAMADTFGLQKVTPDGKVKLVAYKPSQSYFFLNWISWADEKHAYTISVAGMPKNKWKLYRRGLGDLDFTTLHVDAPQNLNPIFIETINGKSFVGSNNGLFEINLNEKKLNFLGYQGEFVSSVVYDFEGNLWLSTLHHGIYFQPNVSIKKYSNISGKINEIAINPYNGEIWCGNPDAFYNINNKGVQKYELPKQKSYNERITGFYFLGENKFLIGSDMCLALMDKNTTTLVDNTLAGIKNIAYNNYNKSILLAKSSTVSELKEIQKNKWQTSTIVSLRSTAVLPESPNTLLIGSNNGLYRYFIKEKTNKLILDTRINQLKKDNVGNIWCTSDVSGLYLLKDTVFTHFTEKDGLHSTSLNKLYIDNQQNVWLATPVGLIKTNYENGKLTATNYLLGNILGNEQVNDLDKKSDTLLVATTSGLYYFIENEFKKETTQPRLVIKSINIGGTVQAVLPQYQLGFEQNNIHIDFTGISYGSQNLHYRYKIEPGSQDWQYTKARSVNLVDLSPGTYTFTLQAIKDGTNYSATQQIVFKIVPPFYRSIWFYVVCIFFLASLVAMLVRARFAHIRKQAFISQVLSESKQKALRAQMNPHFLFNSLISIQSFFLNKRNTEGQEYTSKFSKLIRNILDNSDKEQISIEDEIATLSNYTDLENIRLTTPFVFSVTIDTSVDARNTYIPTMLLQPIVENSIWHGINYLQDIQGKINVHFVMENNVLKITIEDNGVGFAQSAALNKKRAHISKGTQLIKERLEAINLVRKNKISCTMGDKPEGGAKVTLIIPIEK